MVSDKGSAMIESDQSPIGGWVWRVPGAIQWDAAAQAIWVRLGDTLPATPGDLVARCDADLRGAVAAAFADSARTGEALAVTCRTGEAVLELAAVWLPGTSGEQLFAGTVRDVTQRELRQQRLLTGLTRSAGILAAAAHGPVRAVIADDTPDVRLALRTMLCAQSDIEIVAEAGDGEQAVAAVQAANPDLLLLDLSTPILDGIGVLQRVRRMHPRTKVVVLSGYGRDHLAARALHLGASACVDKGGATRGLLSLVTDLFPGRVGPAPKRPGAGLGLQRPGAPAAAAAALPLAALRRCTAGAPAGILATDGGVPDLIAAAVQALRAPLAVLTDTAAELVEGRDHLPSSTVDDRLASLLRNAHAIAQIVSALEDSSGTAADGPSLIPQPVRLSDLVAAALPDLRRLAEPRTVELIVDDDVVVAADPLRIRQVLQNLISNAAHHGAPAMPIEIIVSSDGNTGEIVVVDPAAGIGDAPCAPSTFGLPDRPESGESLGISAAQRVARAHGGDLALADTGDEGSTYVLTLPALAPAPRRKVADN